MRQLPPLQALRAFEAVARHASFNKASHELNASLDAIQHQVRVLEEHLGLLLLRRFGDRVELTQQGEHLLPITRLSFDGIARQVDEIRGKRPSLIVHCSTSLALRWLIRRLGEMEASCPEITVSLACGLSFPPEYNSQFDIDIVYGMDGPPEDESTVLLLEEWMIPLCSPSLLQSATIAPADIVKHRLLINAPDKRDWKRWAAFANVDAIRMEDALGHGMVFDADSSAIETAIAGQGIILANLNYVQSDLESGALVPATTVRPFKLGAHYILLGETPSMAAKTFTRWITKRAAETASEIRNAYSLT